MPIRLPLPTLACVCLLSMQWAAPDYQVRRRMQWQEISVAIELDPAERGPVRCPPSLAPLLAELEASEAARRADARSRLAALNWRHLSWLVPRSRRGSVESRLALGYVVRRLRERCYLGLPPPPLADDER